MSRLKMMSFTPLFFALHIFHASSLNCYQCFNIEPAFPCFGMASNKTCEPGGTINKNYSETCSKEIIPSKHLFGRKDQGLLNDQFKWICYSQEYDFQVNGKPFKGALRGCTIDETYNPGQSFCEKEQLDLEGTDKGVMITVCGCKTDNCNYGLSTDDNGNSNLASGSFCLSATIVIFPILLTIITIQV